MKSKKKIITICSSAAFYKDVLRIEKELKRLGYAVKIPKTARVMEKTGNFNIASYKTWHTNKEDYKKKKALMDGHFKKVIDADAILVVNNEKHGMQGYIGGNVLMEIVIAYHYKKPVYILSPIAEDSPIKEEIYGIFPIFLNGDLTKIEKS